jgi:hypothetical protein
MERSSFVSDAEVNQYINDSYLELYDILVTKFEDYYISTSISTITAATIALPTDFYKLVGLDRTVSEGSSEYYPLKPFNFHNRNRKGYLGLRYGMYPDVQYRILGNNIELVPNDMAGGTYKLWYVPRATVMASDSSTIDGVNGWEEYIVIDAAMKCLAKEESDVSVFLVEKQAIKKRIEEAAQNRDIGETSSIQDVQNNNDDYFYY